MVEAKAKDRGHNFSKLWSANFPLFLSQKSLRYSFCYVFDDNSKTVVSKDNECHFEALHVSRNVNYDW